MTKPIIDSGYDVQKMSKSQIQRNAAAKERQEMFKAFLQTQLGKNYIGIIERMFHEAIYKLEIAKTAEEMYLARGEISAIRNIKEKTIDNIIKNKINA